MSQIKKLKIVYLHFYIFEDQTLNYIDKHPKKSLLYIQCKSPIEPPQL